MYFEVLLEVLKYIWILGLCFLFIAGIWALLLPDSFLRFNRSAGNWIEVYCVNSAFPDRKHLVEGVVYRFHVFIGLLLILASLGIMYNVLFRFNAMSLSEGPVFQHPGSFWLGVLTEFTIAFICLSGVLGLFAGIIIFVRPSVLRPLEAWGNRWIYINWLFQFSERSLFGIDKWIVQNIRLYGFVVLLAAGLIALGAH